jgi:cold shock CspA family protein
MRKGLAKPSGHDKSRIGYHAVGRSMENRTKPPKGMKLGLIRSYSAIKGGGTIEPDNDREPPVFFSTETLRASGIANLKQGDKVSYKLGQDPDVPYRISAVSIKLVLDEYVVDLPF